MEKPEFKGKVDILITETEFVSNLAGDVAHPLTISSFGVYFSHKSNYNNMIHND